MALLPHPKGLMALQRAKKYSTTIFSSRLSGSDIDRHSAGVGDSAAKQKRGGICCLRQFSAASHRCIRSFGVAYPQFINADPMSGGKRRFVAECT